MPGRVCFTSAAQPWLPDFQLILFRIGRQPGGVITANVDEEQSSDRLIFRHIQEEYYSTLVLIFICDQDEERTRDLVARYTLTQLTLVAPRNVQASGFPNQYSPAWRALNMEM